MGVACRAERFENPAGLLGDRLRGVYRFLAENGAVVFGDDYFADLYKESRRGRPTVPARTLATVMVLQALEGLSDQEAVDRLECDLRWQAAAGVDAGAKGFHSTTLVIQRNRLRASDRPKRFLDDTRVAARQAGVLGNRVRVLDSTPVYDAVSTQDTVTQLRAAIRKLLRCLQGTSLAVVVRSVLRRDDDYATPGKPPCDWQDSEAREALVDALVRDALAAVNALNGRTLDPASAEAAELVALIAGQDVKVGDDGLFRIVRGVAADRVISTVDPEARHGHKSNDRRFDGYKAHLSVDPDSELIDDVVVTPANTHDGDGDVVDDLLADFADTTGAPDGETRTVMGDGAYGAADTIERLEDQGLDVNTKVPPASNSQGIGFSKDDFIVDVEGATVTCPAGNTAPIKPLPDGSGRADFGPACAGCPLRASCTDAAKGRSIRVHPKEAVLQRAKHRQNDPARQGVYRSTRPKVERKIAHFVRAGWGARRARTRGVARVTTDAVTRAAAVNWARLATLGLTNNAGTWAPATA